jgi:hypothetical protein
MRAFIFEWNDHRAHLDVRSEFRADVTPVVVCAGRGGFTAGTHRSIQHQPNLHALLQAIRPAHRECMETP